MADIDFPPSIDDPRPLAEGFRILPRSDNKTQTTFTDGATEQRVRFKYDTILISARWEFSDDEFDIFLDFYETTLNDGSLWFNLEFPMSSNRKTTEAQIINIGQRQRIRGFAGYQITLTLECRWDYITPPDPDYADYVNDVGYDNLLDLLAKMKETKAIIARDNADLAIGFRGLGS